MSLPDLARLRELAEAATPGPWRYEPLCKPDGSVYDYGNIGCEDELTFAGPDDDIDWITSDTRASDAEFVAAANPQTVLVLIDAAEQARSLAELVVRISAHGILDRDARTLLDRDARTLLGCFAKEGGE